MTQFATVTFLLEKVPKQNTCQKHKY